MAFQQRSKLGLKGQGVSRVTPSGVGSHTTTYVARAESMDPPRDVFGLPILGAHATVPPAQPQQVPFNPFGFAPMFVGAPQPAAPPNPLPVLPPQPVVLPPPAPVPQPVAASSSLQYDAVRIRQPSQQFSNPNFAVYGVGPSPQQLKREADLAARKEAERVKRQQQKEEARRAAEEEAKAWTPAEDVPLSPEFDSMVRVLQELFSQKHASVSRPFCDAAEAQALGVKPSLADKKP